MAPPEVTQENVDDEVAAIERLRVRISEVRAERTAGEQDAVLTNTHAELTAERARLESELAQEEALSEHSRKSRGSLTDAQEAMRLADQQQRMLAAQQTVESAVEKVVEDQAKDAGTDAVTAEKAVDLSIKDAEKNANLAPKVDRTTADQAPAAKGAAKSGKES